MIPDTGIIKINAGKKILDFLIKKILDLIYE